MEFQYLLSRAHFGEKAFGVKHVFVWLLHGEPPLDSFGSTKISRGLLSGGRRFQQVLLPEAAPL
jgi:hypothetical protein